jgi:hypothetical protein
MVNYSLGGVEAGDEGKCFYSRVGAPAGQNVVFTECHHFSQYSISVGWVGGGGGGVNTC